MKLHNLLPHLHQCVLAWEKPPTRAVFDRDYLQPIEPLLQPLLEDFGSFGRPGLHRSLLELDWATYREETLRLDPVREEARLREQMRRVEQSLGQTLRGDVILFGAFTLMDGYARFHEGNHRVYLGVDESHGRGAYLDILQSHELTHVLREGQESVWRGFGLDPKMSHDDFTLQQPVIEHLFSEGFSCVVSERLNPGEDVWHYVYQTEESLAEIQRHGPALDRRIHAELKRGAKGVYRSLYDVSSYRPEVPYFAHYVWAWAWVRQLVVDFGGGDPRQLLERCSADFADHALQFKL